MALLQRRERDGVLVNLTSHGAAIARVTEGEDRKLDVSSMAELASDDEGALKAWVEQEFPDRVSTYLNCFAGFSPAERLLERESINGKRVMDQSYVRGLLNIRHPNAATGDWQLAFLNQTTGRPLEADTATRPGLFFGVPLMDISNTQKRLVGAGLRPARLELGILPLLGAVLKWQAFTKYTHQIAICEIGLTTTRMYILAKDGIHTPPPLPHGITSIAEAAMKELSAPDIATARKALEEPTEAMRSHAKRHVRMLSRHLRPAVDFFEMQTGQRVGALFCAHLPSKYHWLEEALAPAVELDAVSPKPELWEEILGVRSKTETPLPATWYQHLSLVASLEPIVQEAVDG